MKKYSHSPLFLKHNVLFVFSFFLIFGCSEETKVKNVCNQFIKGRVALENGDSLQLKQVTEDSLFRLIMLNEAYVKIVDAPVIGPEIAHIRAKSAEIKEDCASCSMYAQSHYEIHLCKYDGEWKIKGENAIYATPEKLSKARKKLADYKIFLKEKPARDSVFSVLDDFFTGAKQYFKTQESTLLQQTCDEATFDFIQQLFWYSIERTGLDPIINEMEKPDYTTFDVKFTSDKVTCQFYSEETEVNFQRKGGTYVIVGINGLESKNITEGLIKENYPNFLRGLRLIRAEKYQSENIFWANSGD